MPMSAALTSRQQQILSFIQDCHRETGLVPTLQETATHFGFRSPNSVRQHLRLIEKKGFVHRLPGRSRALVLAQHEANAADLVRVPLVGRIPAGIPDFAEESAEEMLPLPAHLFHGSGLFALRVHGSSMTGAGILDGDIAILDAKLEVKTGSIAGVLIENDATLKRVYRSRDELSLKAENPAFPDIKLTAKAAKLLKILGVLVGVVRKI